MQIKKTQIIKKFYKRLSIIAVILVILSSLFGVAIYTDGASALQGNIPACNGGTPSKDCVVCAKEGQKANGKTIVNCSAKPDCNAENGCNIVEKYINPTINVLAMIVGLLSVISIMIGGVQFASSDGDPQKAAAAKGRIAKTIVALVSFMFLYAFLQFLVPGGIFNG